MLTAAVRDLHRCHPGKFQTDIRTPFPEIWQSNPYITVFDDHASGVTAIDCHYPLIHQSNSRPCHFLHGFSEFLSECLGVRFVPMEFRGDIHLTPAEKESSVVKSLLGGHTGAFWLISAGGKSDFTIKWWASDRFQKVVDAFAGEIIFVQVGSSEHFHPPLRNVIDLRGKTTLRQLIQLVHHSSGAVCPVTLLMHLAAAVETSFDASPNRPCVVIAGGREPPHWEAYPTHQFIHTVGALDCCREGGCWRSRTVRLGDGDIRDHPRHLCEDVVSGPLPRCMDMITDNMVIERIRIYISGRH